MRAWDYAISGRSQNLVHGTTTHPSDLKEFVKGFPAQDWDVPQDFNFMNNFLRATPRKLVVHVLMHEIRHWAQIGTLLRLNGLKGEFHDFLFSPVLGGEFKRAAS